SARTADDLTRRPVLLAWDAAVVMSHNYHNDLRFLRVLLPVPLRYLGVLGPKSRTESLLRDITAGGFTPTAQQTERLYGPVGLDIGADTPEEIALAVAAEIRAVLAGRSGLPLRKSDHPIHDRPPDEIRPLVPAWTIDERVCLVEAD
ncbi:MAG: XdhC family protein, partial [Gemmatimonadales bacterium]